MIMLTQMIPSQQNAPVILGSSYISVRHYYSTFRQQLKRHCCINSIVVPAN